MLGMFQFTVIAIFMLLWTADVTIKQIYIIFMIGVSDVGSKWSVEYFFQKREKEDWFYCSYLLATFGKVGGTGEEKLGLAGSIHLFRCCQLIGAISLLSKANHF